MLILIDNYDSFTYNLVQYLGELGAEIQIHRNDKITVDQIRALHPEHIVISPGPCTPTQAGISVDVVRELGPEVPLLGVCLGHQSIAQAFGGKVIRGPEIVHGKTSEIHHDGDGVLKELENPFTATRYHSLIVEASSLPDCLHETAWVEKPERLIMGLKHNEYPIHGVQFHPESILTDVGKQLLGNFLHL